ncbi:MAG: GDP-L-fucose synthase [Candidatus Marinimicrobia bacterium]|nr:GDP-L-fucose synthase [Candidatus Neomarinimicrobiota bacterium]
MSPNSKIFIAGHNGMVGSAIWRNLESKGYTNIIGKSSKELDLRTQKSVIDYFEEEKPEFVFLAAAKVGGILANDTYRAEFIYDNLQIQNNVIHQSYVHGVKKLLFLGSSCIYPRDCPQPMKEEYLLTGELEQTNEPYAIAKIAGIKMCESYYRQYGANFISAMPTNLYGPHDNFDLESSHVIPAIIRKIHEAKKSNLPFVEVWGTGKPLREFLHVDDLANACIFILENINAKDIHSQNTSHINIGSGEEISIGDVTNLISNISGYKGRIKYDISKPDGTMRKLLDSSRVNYFGWKSYTDLIDGLRMTYDWFLKNNG